MKSMLKGNIQRVLAAVAVFAVIMTGSAAGQWSKDWKVLGSRTVDLSADRDEIRCADEGFIQRLVIEVKKSGVRFLDMKVHLGNGEIIDIPLKEFIKAGKRSRVIDLPGEARIVKKIVFWYESVRNRKAEVVIWGKKN